MIDYLPTIVNSFSSQRVSHRFILAVPGFYGTSISETFVADVPILGKLSDNNTRFLLASFYQLSIDAKNFISR